MSARSMWSLMFTQTTRENFATLASTCDRFRFMHYTVLLPRLGPKYLGKNMASIVVITSWSRYSPIRTRDHFVLPISEHPAPRVSTCRTHGALARWQSAVAVIENTQTYSTRLHSVSASWNLPLLDASSTESIPGCGLARRRCGPTRNRVHYIPKETKHIHSFCWLPGCLFTCFLLHEPPLRYKLHSNIYIYTLLQLWNLPILLTLCLRILHVKIHDFSHLLPRSTAQFLEWDFQCDTIEELSHWVWFRRTSSVFTEIGWDGWVTINLPSGIALGDPLLSSKSIALYPCAEGAQPVIGTTRVFSRPVEASSRCSCRSHRHHPCCTVLRAWPEAVRNRKNFVRKLSKNRKKTVKKDLKSLFYMLTV